MVKRIWRREGRKSRTSNRSGAGFGLMTVRASGCDRPTRTMSGPMISSRTAPTTARRSACSPLSMSTCECPAIHVKRKLNSQDVLYVLAKLFLRHGPSEHIRSDNGPEFVATAVREWLGRLSVKTLFITSGSPWENGYNESFNGKLQVSAWIWKSSTR